MYKKLIAIILALSVLILSVPFNSMNVNAAVSDTGLVVNPGFEDSTKTSMTSSDGVWKLWYSSIISDASNIHSGKGAVKVTTGDTAAEQTIKGLKPNTKYFFTIWAKTTDANTKIYIGVKNYGGAEIKQQVTATSYTQYSIEFTTGASNTSALIFIWGDSGIGTVYADDAAVSTQAYINSISATNSQATVVFDDTLTSSPLKEDFELSYVSDANPGTVVPLAVSNFAYDNTSGSKHATLDFTTIGAIAVSQTISLDVKYRRQDSQYETSTKTFIVDADGSAVVKTEINTVTATNGKLEILLKNTPTVAPKATDFTATYSINAGAYSALTLGNFAYDMPSKKVTLIYSSINRTTSDQSVSVKVLCNAAETESSFTVLAASGNTYYIDSASGLDSNNGTSKATAWQSITKVNSTTFQPGDRILFKADSSWTGELWPKGSGLDTLPIVIDKYGTGNKPLINGNGGTNTFKLFNQSYWEVNNLELTDNAATAGTRRAVLVEAQDIGLAKHIYLRNLDIHDVTGDNNEKRSGGIIILVTGNITPTIYDDVRIENNYIRRVNRTGIKAIRSVWDKRNNWVSSDNSGDWKGSTNLVIKNNYIENIGGDGMLIRDAIAPLVEHNVVRSAQETSPYAVGMFNWNTDDCIFQYNEAYDTKQTLDGMGYDIDGLTQNTIMQYNYSHDNEGGFVMICSTETLLATDSIIRYNISQNDRNRIFETRPGSFRTLAYNNTIYTGPGQSLAPQYLCADYDNEGGSIEIYNNLYVNEGVASNGPWNKNRKGYTAGATYDNNLFFGNFSSYPVDANILKVNPMLVAPGTAGMGIDTVDGYKLKAGSPCIDTGKTIANNGGRDYWGNALTDGKTDIGAHEYSGETVSKPDFSKNMVTNGSFETGTRYGWTPTNAVAFDTTNPKTGVFCTKVTAAGSSLEQLVRELYPTSKYVVKVWSKLDNATDTAWIGVKDSKGTEIGKVQIVGTNYNEYSIPFTADATQTSANVFVKMESGTGSVYADDVTLVEDLSAKKETLSLKLAITEATGKLNSTIPGSNPGCYSQSVYDNLSSKLAEANSVLNNVASIQADIDLATSNINKALVDFEAGLVPVKLGDLAKAIDLAKIKYDAAVEGSAVGQYANGSKILLDSTMTTAKAAVTGDIDIQKATLVALTKAVYLFDNSIFIGKKITTPMTATADSSETVQGNNAASNAVDGKTTTLWHSNWDTGNVLPHWITVDLGASKKVTQYTYLPRQDGQYAGMVKKYELYVSTDNITFNMISSGTWALYRSALDKSEKVVSFDPVDARYLKLVILDADVGYCSAAEIKVFEEVITTSESIADGIKSITAPVVGDTQLNLPTVPAGYSIAIKSASPEGVIALNGKITAQKEATTVSVILTVTKDADKTSSDTKAISVNVPATAVTAQTVADGIKSITAPVVGDTQLNLPTVPAGYSIAIKSASPEGVIALNGKITAQKEATTVSVILTVTKDADKTSADTEAISVNVPATAVTAQTVADGIKSITAPVVGDNQLNLPTVPAGYSIAIKSASPEGVIALNGKITSPKEATTVSVILTVTKDADKTSADTEVISVNVPATAVTAQTVADGIKSITAPVVGDNQLNLPTVPAGYSIAIKSASPKGVIALNGKITSPKEATTVSVILTVTKDADKTSADTKAISVTVPGLVSRFVVETKFKANTSEVTTLAGNTDKYINAFVTATNNDSSNMDVVIIMAAYDKYGAFVTSAAQHSMVIAKGQITLEAGMMATPNVAKIKVFVMEVKGEEYKGVYPEMKYIPLTDGIEIK